MKSIRIVDVYSYTEWAAGVYQAKDGEEYDVTLTKNYDKNIGCEQCEVVNIEKAGIEIPDSDPIWKEVKIALKNKKSPRRSSNSEQGHKP